MRTVYNLLTGEEQTYGPGVTPEQAVKASYAHSNGLSSQVATKGIDALDLEVVRGKHFVSCGDWTCRYK